jgi:hypothetical protein
MKLDPSPPDASRALGTLRATNLAFVALRPAIRRAASHVWSTAAATCSAPTGREARRMADARLRGVRRTRGLDRPARLGARRARARVVEARARRPVEDFRIGFEDGYGAADADETDVARQR